MEFWATVGLSAFVAVALSSFISIWGVSRSIKHKSVIEERQKWRDSLRELIPEFVSTPSQSTRSKLRDSIVLRLNPYKDVEALVLLDRFVSSPEHREREAVMAHFQDLLKRDWEKAKIEAGFMAWRADAKADRIVDEQRRMLPDK